jgi:hypothetical protein
VEAALWEPHAMLRSSHVGFGAVLAQTRVNAELSDVGLAFPQRNPGAILHVFARMKIAEAHCWRTVRTGSTTQRYAEQRVIDGKGVARRSGDVRTKLSWGRLSVASERVLSRRDARRTCAAVSGHPVAPSFRRQSSGRRFRFDSRWARGSGC